MIESAPASAVAPTSKIASMSFTRHTSRTCGSPGHSYQILDRPGEASDVASAGMARRPGISPLTVRLQRAGAFSYSQHLMPLLDVGEALGLGHLLNLENAQHETRQGMSNQVDTDPETRAIAIIFATASTLLRDAWYGKGVALVEVGDRIAGSTSICASLTVSRSVRPSREVVSPGNTPANRRFWRCRAQLGLSPRAYVALVSFGSQ